MLGWTEKCSNSGQGRLLFESGTNFGYNVFWENWEKQLFGSIPSSQLR